MKSLRLLFVASLVANAALVAVLLLRPPPSTPAPPPTAASTGTSAAAKTADQKNAALFAALANGDSAALAAAGVPPEVIAQLGAARAFGRLAKISREQDNAAATATTEYWHRDRNAPRPRPTPEQRAARAAAEREFETAMRAAFGDNPFGGDGDRMGFLPAATRDKLHQIERDYQEMRQEVSGESEGVQLAADREKWRLLEAEKQRDIAAALTPAEREQLELRTSRSANVIIERYGDIVANEDEYKRLYALQKAFDDQYSTPEYQSSPHTPEENRARNEAERQLNDDLRAALGDDRWAATSRQNDREYRSLTALATRLGLPEATADQVYVMRDAYATRSVAIDQNAALDPAGRRTQLNALATRAKTELRAVLGADGADAYVRQAGWVQFMQNGSAFTTDARQLPPGSARPPGNTTAYALPPPRPPPPPKP